jgi:hypothetical protein
VKQHAKLQPVVTVRRLEREAVLAAATTR